MNKKYILPVIIIFVLIVGGGIIYVAPGLINSANRLNNREGSDFWIPINSIKTESRKTIATYELTKNTKLPLEVAYPNGAISVTNIKYGKDIWTADKEPTPSVVVKKGETPTLANFGFAVELDSDYKMKYASHRDIRPDGTFDSKPYKVVYEETISSVDNDLEKYQIVKQYTLELNAVEVNPVEPVFKLELFTQELKTGKVKSVTYN